MAAGMGDKAQPVTSILVQTVCTNFFELPGGAHSTGAASSRLGVLSKGFFFLTILSIWVVIFISPVGFPSFCKLMGFSFHFFSSSN